MKHFSNAVLEFLGQLKLPFPPPPGVKVMNPYREKEAWSLCERFYKKYYSDTTPRSLVLGINPGRFGGGVTGIPFTDPVKLEEDCGIKNSMPKKAELSSDFIYSMIAQFGGPASFYKNFLISAVSPLGFTRDNRNLNYYDDRVLKEKLNPFAIDCLKKQMRFGVRRDYCFCLGEGENFRYLKRLNAEHSFFAHIIPLPHPRFIMQYRRKRKEEFISLYIEQLKNATI
jgi:Domain of unknown function (DUF4918)